MEATNGNESKTLRSYYLGLPDTVSPKSAFIRRVAKRTGVTFTTVRNWIIYGMRPKNEEHVRVLSEETGISPDELWRD